MSIIESIGLIQSIYQKSGVFKSEEDNKIQEDEKKSLENYKIIKILGTGTFGTVSLAEDLSNGEKVAIKEIYLSQTTEEEVREEFNLVMMFNHERIIKVHTMFKPTPEKIVIILEYCEGGTLREEFEKYYNSKQKIPEELIKKWLYQILDGLRSLHIRKIIHRDIKPDNIMLDKNKDIKIIDFGTSKCILKKQQSNTLKGSPMFIAPEILMQDQNQKIDGKADIFSVGIILYVLCFMEYPYMSNNPLQVRNDIISGEINKRMNPFNKKNQQYPDDLKFIYDKMVALDPKERYTSKQLLELPYFKNNSQLGPTVFEKDQEWIESAYKYILHIFYTISERPLERTKQSIKIYLKILREKKYFDTLVFFACHTILIDIYTNECLHLKVLKQFEDIEKEIPNEFLEAQLSINNYFTCIYFTRKIENSLKLGKIVDIKSPNFQKLFDENLKDEKKSNQFSIMLIYEALAYSSYMKSDFEKAFGCIQKSINASFEINYMSFALDIAHLHNIAGIVYSKCGYEPLIEQYFLQSITIRDLINTSKDKVPLYFGSCYFGSYLNLGNYYLKAEDFVKSKFYFEKALIICNNSPDLQLLKLNKKFEVNIAICDLYLNPKILIGDFTQNNEELKILEEYSKKILLEDLFSCVKFMNACGIYYATINSKNRALKCFNFALKLILDSKCNEILGNIILNNIGVLHYIFGDKSLLLNPINFVFQNFRIDNSMFLNDDIYFWIFINYINYLMIQNQNINNNPLLQNGVQMLESFTINFSKYYFDKSRSIKYFTFNSNEMVFFNYEKYMHCFLTISNYIIFKKKSENYKKIKEEIFGLVRHIEEYRNSQKISQINFLSKQLDYIKILINYLIIKNSPPIPDSYFDSIISEFIQLLTTLIQMDTRLESKIYFLTNIFLGVFFLTFKMYKTKNLNITFDRIKKLAEYEFKIEIFERDKNCSKILDKIICYVSFIYLQGTNIKKDQKEELLEAISEENKKALNIYHFNKESTYSNKVTEAAKNNFEKSLFEDIMKSTGLDKEKANQISQKYYPNG